MLRRLIDQSYKLGNTHLMSCLTALPLIEEFYRNHPTGRLFLSKGHAWFALATVLEAQGFEPDWTLTHPERDEANGVMCTSGSLGHGLPMAIGYALAQPWEIVGCLLGDAECMEGTFWESLCVLDRWSVGNLRVVVDCNGYGATGPVFVDPESMCPPGVPIRFVRTVRGQGVKLFQENPEWHVHKITEAEYERMVREL